MDFDLSQPQRELRETAREFATSRVRPTAQRLDGRPDPTRTYPSELIEEASALGLRTLSFPERYGGRETDELTETVVLEELSYGDVGFGMTIAHPWREGRMIDRFGTAEQRERFLSELADDPRAVTSLAITEGHSGSDNALPFTDDLQAGPRTRAVRDGREWVLNGSKRWITNGNVAQLLLVAARTDETVPWPEGISLFIVPAGTAGLRIGAVEDKLGIRLNQNAELTFEDCRIPDEQLLGSENGGGAILRAIAPSSKAKEAAKSLGVGRAALEAAQAWTSSRVQGGSRLSAHGSIQSSLAEMGTQLEAARGLMWRAAWASEHDTAAAHQLGDMAKVFTSRIVSEVALRALELHGAYGIQRGADAERLLRDAVSMLHAPAGNDAVLRRIHSALEPAVA